MSDVWLNYWNDNNIFTITEQSGNINENESVYNAVHKMAKQFFDILTKNLDKKGFYTKTLKNSDVECCIYFHDIGNVTFFLRLKEGLVSWNEIFGSFNLKIYYKPSISGNPVIGTFKQGFQWSGTWEGRSSAEFIFKIQYGYSPDFTFNEPNDGILKSDWYKLYLKDKSIYADNSYRMFKAKHKVTNELAVITMIGGGLLATGFKGSSSEIFREATNQTANSSVFYTQISNSSVEMPYKSYNYLNSINSNLSSAVKEVENVSLVQKIKDWGKNLIGNVKATGVYCMATGNQALLKALGFIESTAGMYILKGSVFLTLSKSLGEGSEIGDWKIISVNDVTGSSADAIAKQSEYWDAVNQAIRNGQSNPYTTDTAGNTTHTGDTSAIENEDKAIQSIESLNKSIQNIANNISSSTSANTTVQTAIQNAINNLTDVNRNGLQGIQNNISAGTSIGQTMTIDPNYKMPIDISQLEYMINTTSGLPIQTQPLAQLLISGLQINADSVKNGINLNAPKIDDVNLKLDSATGTQLKEISDTLKLNKEKESKILDSQIDNIPKNQDILDLKHKDITQKVHDLDYAQRQAKTFSNLHSPSTYTNEDGVTFEKGYYSNPSLSQAREYNASLISHGKIEGAKSFKGKMDILKDDLSFLDDDRIKARFEDINPDKRFDVNSLISKIKL